MSTSTLPTLPRVAAIHDLSAFGKCSLTVALPVLSACGIEVCPLPTALLSTHSGGLGAFTQCDLSAQLLPIATHWQRLGVQFDALYTGYLSHPAQGALVQQVMALLCTPRTLLVVDPVLGDDGKLYRSITPQMVDCMAQLAQRAQLLLPNATEAALLLQRPYTPLQGTRALKETLRALCALNQAQVVLTGISLGDDTVGCACMDAQEGLLYTFAAPRVPGHYHGTGDLFASALLAARLHHATLPQAAEAAVAFTAQCIRQTHTAHTDTRFGVRFEPELAAFARTLRAEQEDSSHA